jgi:hypothetical protein
MLSGPTWPSSEVTLPEIRPRIEADTPQRRAKRISPVTLVGPTMPTLTGRSMPQARSFFSQPRMASGSKENWLVMLTFSPCAFAAAIFASSAASSRSDGIEGWPSG